MRDSARRNKRFATALRSLPAWFAFLDPVIVRAYGADDSIRYDTGDVVRGNELTAACERILGDPGCLDIFPARAEKLVWYVE